VISHSFQQCDSPTSQVRFCSLGMKESYSARCLARIFELLLPYRKVQEDRRIGEYFTHYFAVLPAHSHKLPKFIQSTQAAIRQSAPQSLIYPSSTDSQLFLQAENVRKGALKSKPFITGPLKITLIG
jgi:hypothetical protein